MSVSETIGISGRIRQAFTAASRKTGVDFDYLLKTAQRESSLNPKAMASTSTASGLFQFIESTWLKTMKDHGGKFGLAYIAQKIKIDETGKYDVGDAQLRAKILSLRNNPEVSALLAGIHTASNFNALNVEIGRPPSSGELYMAHFLGNTGAAKLIRATNERPDLKADLLFPQQARANRPIFYSPNGSSLSVSQLYDTLTQGHDGSSQVVDGLIASSFQSVRSQAPVAKPGFDAVAVPTPFVPRESLAGFSASRLDPLLAAFQRNISKSATPRSATGAFVVQNFAQDYFIRNSAANSAIVKISNPAPISPDAYETPSVQTKALRLDAADIYHKQVELPSTLAVR